jgi:catechol-2,3-dioxygenase
MHIAFSHVGLFVENLPKMEAFYREVMGFHLTDRGMLNGNAIAFLSRDPREHHQIVLVAGRVAAPGTRLVNQISFRVPTLADLQIFFGRLNARNTPNIDPVLHGNAWSVYFADPEGNRLEVFTDSDWYIEQPIRERIDLSLPEKQIRKLTYDYCVGRPGFKPFAEWRGDMERLMGTAAAPARES